jgi:hypothetical protein
MDACAPNYFDLQHNRLLTGRCAATRRNTLKPRRPEGNRSIQLQMNELFTNKPRFCHLKEKYSRYLVSR